MRRAPTGQQLRDLREVAGESLDAVAHEAGFGLSYLSRMERGLGADVPAHRKQAWAAVLRLWVRRQENVRKARSAGGS